MDVTTSLISPEDTTGYANFEQQLFLLRESKMSKCKILDDLPFLTFCP